MTLRPSFHSLRIRDQSFRVGVIAWIQLPRLKPRMVEDVPNARIKPKRYEVGPMRTTGNPIFDGEVGAFDGDRAVLKGITAISCQAGVTSPVNHMIVTSDLRHSTRGKLI